MPNPPPRLERWFFTGQDYTAPEKRVPYVAGEIYGHPNKARFPDGKKMRTSGVVEYRDGVVTTLSGSQYRLGEPKPDYVAFMQQHYPGWDPADPMNVPNRKEPDA